jgi:hypothetical protein
MARQQKGDPVIWAILFALGVPLWLIALGIGSLVIRGRRLRRRPGNIRCRLRRPGGKRWLPGHAVWVHGVFVFDGSPAAWVEEVVWVAGVTRREAVGADARKLRRLGPGPQIVSLELDAGARIDVAMSRADGIARFVPFGAEPVAPVRQGEPHGEARTELPWKVAPDSGREEEFP